MKAKKLLAVVLAAVLLVSVLTVSVAAAGTITTKPGKVTYLVGEFFDPAGLKVKVGRNTYTYSATNAKFSFDPDLETPLTTDMTAVGVYYNGDYVNDVAITVNGVVNKPTKVYYMLGECFNPAGLSVKVDGTTHTYTAGDGNFTFVPNLTTPLAANNTSVKIAYNGVDCGTLAIGVNGLVTGASKTDYTVGEKFNPAGIKIAYNGSEISYTAGGKFSFEPSLDYGFNLDDESVKVLYDGNEMGTIDITVKGLICGPTNSVAIEGRSPDLSGLKTNFNGAEVAYDDAPSNFSFDPSMNQALKVGEIYTFDVYCNNYYVGDFDLTVDHDFGDFVQLESGKEHAKICKQCGQLSDLTECAASVHNFKPNDDAGFFKLQTETGTCDICGGTVTRNIEGSNNFDSIFDFVNEDGMAETELLIFKYFRLILVSLIQMIIPV